MSKFEIIDLTLELSPDMIFPEESHSIFKLSELGKTSFWDSPFYKIEISSHTGTYIEIPWNEFPKDFLLREAVVVDLSEIWMRDVITEAKFENLYIDGGMGVILKTKWYSRWTSGEIFKDYPVLSLPACNILIEKRIKFIGIDFPISKEAHDLFLSRDIFLIHNLYNLLSIKKEKIFLVIAPLSIKSLKIIPSRVFALQPV
ncbi:MAG: cyclase family protein [Dictyoglomaceae bacterium]